MLLRAIDAADDHYRFHRLRLAVLSAVAATVGGIAGNAMTRACAARKIRLQHNDLQQCRTTDLNPL